MAGILNSKERLIDFIITPQGRRQMIDGRMRIEFATLTDQHTFYSTTHPDNVADDASQRIFFETYTSTTDTIVPEIDAGDKENNLQPFRAGSFTVDGKTFAEGTYTTSTGSYYQVLTGSRILNRSVQLTESIVKHFEGLRILGTEDQFSNQTGFATSAVSGTFVITDQDLSVNQGSGIYLKDLDPNQPGEFQSSDGVVDLRTSPSIYTDPRLGHLPNYRYLPPRNLPGENQNPDDPSLIMGSYPNFSNQPEGSSTEIGVTEADSRAIVSSLSNRQNIVIDFDETSIENNVVAQLFEFSREGVEKLSIIDYGIHTGFDFLTPPGVDFIDETPKQIFFLGKLLQDEEEVQTFMNIFTIVFEQKEE